jgi:hypothetical protein
MTDYVTISIAAIDRHWFPWFASFELLDCHGQLHQFVDKAPVIGLTEDEERRTVFPFEATLPCTVLSSDPTRVQIDTSRPYGIEALSGETRFCVPLSALRRPSSL